MIYETLFLLSLTLTLVIEIVVLLVLSKYLIKKIKFKKIIIAGLIASILTLPYLWFVLPAYLSSLKYIIIGELLVVLIETLIYWNLLNIKFNKALLISFICNLISFLIGLLVF